MRFFILWFKCHLKFCFEFHFILFCLNLQSFLTAVKYCILHNISVTLTKNRNRQCIHRRIDFCPCDTRLHQKARNPVSNGNGPLINHSAFNTGNNLFCIPYETDKGEYKWWLNQYQKKDFILALGSATNSLLLICVINLFVMMLRVHIGCCYVTESKERMARHGFKNGLSLFFKLFHQMVKTTNVGVRHLSICMKQNNEMVGYKTYHGELHTVHGEDMFY